ncbi:MAG: SLC13 family permease [Rhodospirillaceae bacterium]|nr:SLC13 family permease [Rhodospirillaceae bacterium]
MTVDQIVAAGLVVLALALFAWGRWRFDIVALVVLLAGVAAGIVAPDAAFAGFGHPAVITVAAVLIASRGLEASGVVDAVALRLLPAEGPFVLRLAILCGLVAFLSAFMNNVGALALVMPVALAMARKANRPPGRLLMPVAFASMLGGMATLIGTPPNVVVATYRGTSAGTPFALFDFLPVGGAVALAGLAFIVLVGWRLIPRRQGAGDDLFGIEEYVAEVGLQEKSPLVGLSVAELDDALAKHELEALVLSRGDRQVPAYAGWERVRADDVILVEGAPEALRAATGPLGLTLAGNAEEEEGEGKKKKPHLAGEEMVVVEAVVQPRTLLVGLTAEEMRLRSRYLVNLLAVARQGSRFRGRLKTLRFAAGDVLLLQGPRPQINAALRNLGLLPLAERRLDLGRTVKPLIAVGIMGAALAGIALAGVSAAVALTAAAVAQVLTNTLTLRDAYDAVDWPILILLGAMIPVGHALESTGTTAALAEWLARVGKDLPPVVLLAVVLVATMTLSDVINNAATAVMMAPLAADLAKGIGANPDAFLMAVAIGASCAFLTPIGHQNNTLVMGPGGYRFWDYWRMGLPLELLIVAVSIPMLLLAWPL